ncbi:MAG: hypothetical protein VB108_04045 [Anaerolineaceae bacterium]|nr:hypothetical protein [Anaerolineaceae bacterium]
MTPYPAEESLTPYTSQDESYPLESKTPPTAFFGTKTLQTIRTRTPLPTRTPYRTTQFVTSTSSYANTAAAIRTKAALTQWAATGNSFFQTPQPVLMETTPTETPTLTSTAVATWTSSPSFTNYPTVLTTPRILDKASPAVETNLKNLLMGLGVLVLAFFVPVGIWAFRKKS